jgi:membrane AbrB-like protein
MQWITLLALSAVLVTLLELAHLPAALLLGPMVAGILVSIRETTLRVTARFLVAAQGIIGCMIGSHIPAAILTELVRDWPLFLLGVLSVIAAASALGWVLMRWRILPGTTAIWGISPGASTPMIVMSEDYGADSRLVAVMQYLRVVIVVMVAAVVARLWGSGSAPHAASIVWFPPVAIIPLIASASLAVAAAFVALYLRITAGPFLVPLALGMIAQDMGWLDITLPPWLLAISYAVIGWNVGLRFTRQILLYAARSLPQVLASVIALVLLCGLFAGVLVVVGGIDPLTAYLATSPGGADSVAIIAASTNVDLQFVLAMQTVRLVVVLFTGPSLARFITKLAVGSPKSGP